MTQPDHRATLTALTRALRDLHKQLIHVETQYFGQVGSPLEHLQLITNHPQFAWLQRLSVLMAELDERLDDPQALDDATARDYRAAVEALIGPGAPSNQEFRDKYSAMLHDGADVVMAHGAVRAVLAGLPKPGQPG
ncbi:hypothetical protein ACLB1G_01745 [Oxalobacteraceae bacterium A2-2]